MKIRKYRHFIGSTRRIKNALGTAPINGPKNGDHIGNTYNHADQKYIRHF